ncbi:MAG: cation-translocating P-type ATPase, partial [Calditrichaeota bacterium]
MMNKLKLKKEKLEIVGMDCADCALRVEKAVRKVTGIEKVHVNFIDERLTIEYDDQKTSLSDISLAVRNAGYSLKTVTGEEDFRKRRIILTAISGIFAVTGVFLNQIADSVFTIPVFLLAIFSGGYPIAIKGWKEARRISLGINFLMTVAVIGAMIIGEWTEAAFVVFLFSLAELIESFSVARARRSIKSLMELAPDTAWIKTAFGQASRKVDDIQVGEIILVRPGNRIPLDGVIAEGNSMVNQAPVTGESQPVEKQQGDDVFAGTINQYGSLEIRVSRTSENSMLSKIIRLVEEARTQKAPIERFVEKFSRYYTPAIVIVAILVAILPPVLWGGFFSDWFYRALVLLVISCPCALVISTPVTIVSALNNAARNGILIKG